MKTTLEPEDIEQIALKVVEMLIPVIASNGNKKANDDVIFDVKRLQAYLNVSDKWIYERTHLNELPHLKIKGLLRFRKNDIDKWLDKYIIPLVSEPSSIHNNLKKNFKR